MAEEEKDVKLQRFGRYLLLDHLVDGGMAKICRARFLGEQGNKVVAIKMIQAQYSQDPSFKKMFMDEIKVTFGLIHPNIAQTYDYGFLNNQLYTAIEYVDGKNLKQFLDRLKERKFVFPVEISTFITSQICQGLTYAHNFNDKLTGKILNIIHRDISPHNIMITYDGAVKIIDFGIAKAETNSEETKAGTIKGKLSYLAPEYLEGMELDHRYDQFAVGITLWELLCSRKLFQANNELATLKLIQGCKVPIPSSINPNVPKELDQIVLKSLSKDRNLRFQNMDQFNRALVKFLYSHYPDFNATDLNYFAKELFKDDIKADREKLVKFGQIDITPYLNEFKHEGEGGGGNPNHAFAAPAAAKPEAPPREEAAKSGGGPRPTVLEFGLDEEGDQAGGVSLEIGGGTKSRAAATKPSARPTSSGAAKSGSAAPRANAQRQQDSSNPKFSPPRSGGRSDSGSKFVSNKAADSEEKGKGPGSREGREEGKKAAALPAVAGLGLVLVGGFFAKEHIMNFLGDKQAKSDSPSAKRIPSSTSPSDPQVKSTRTMKFLNTNFNQKFFVNNAEIKYDVSGIELPLNTEIKLRVEEQGKRPIFTNLRVTDDGPGSMKLPNSVPGYFGILKSASDYSENTNLTIYIDGNEVIYKLPIFEEKIPVGKYQGVISNSTSGVSKEVSFEITENAITKLPK